MIVFILAWFAVYILLSIIVSSIWDKIILRLKIRQKCKDSKNQIVDTVILSTYPETMQFDEIDALDGLAFEQFCANILKKNGFTNVRVTQGSADQGVDILAQKDDIKYAIQCKCYSSNLGNTPIQEVNAGKMFYNCQVGVVMTNSYFTKGAYELAEKTGTLLWDRKKLKEMIGS